MLSSLFFRTSLSVLIVSVLIMSMFALGCNQGDERLEEKAKIEGKAQAQAELQAQIDNLEKKVEIAKAEGRAQAEAEISADNTNRAAKAQQMEADLATRHLFYQALKGTYEGALATERGEFRVRITLIPSLPPATYARSRQLEEITSDLNNLYFHAQILEWNPTNRLSAVGCRVENIRPNINKGEIAIASSTCPNLYKLRIVDPEAEHSVTTEENPTPKDSEVSNATAIAIREGKITELSEIRGEKHPTTNASIYTFSVKRSLTR